MIRQSRADLPAVVYFEVLDDALLAELAAILTPPPARALEHAARPMQCPYADCDLCEPHTAHDPARFKA